MVIIWWAQWPFFKQQAKTIPLMCPTGVKRPGVAASARCTVQIFGSWAALTRPMAILRFVGQDNPTKLFHLAWIGMMVIALRSPPSDLYLGPWAAPDGHEKTLQGFYSLRRHHLIGMGIPIINLRRSSDRHRFIIGIPITVSALLVNRGVRWTNNQGLCVSSSRNNHNKRLLKWIGPVVAGLKKKNLRGRWSNLLW